MKSVTKTINEKEEALKAKQDAAIPFVKKVEGSKGTLQVVRAINEYFHNHGKSPAKLKLNKDTMDVLKNILVEAGFDKKSLSDLFDQMLADSATGMVSLADIIAVRETNTEPAGL